MHPPCLFLNIVLLTETGLHKKLTKNVPLPSFSFAQSCFLPLWFFCLVFSFSNCCTHNLVLTSLFLFTETTCLSFSGEQGTGKGQSLPVTNILPPAYVKKRRAEQSGPVDSQLYQSSSTTKLAERET